MAKFSERIGIKPPKSIIQKDSIDSELKNALWNGLVIFYWKKFDANWYNSSRSHIKILWLQIWVNYFKNKLDELEENKPNFILQVKNYFFNCEWYQVYELIEFVYSNYKPDFLHNEDTNSKFTSYCNSVLERELSGYRFINGNFIPITSDEEIRSIETALNVSDTFQPVKAHLNRAVQHLSNKQRPDYRNSIKESISAVEALCAIITKDQKATLGQALKTIEKDYDLHPALKNSFSNLYGYTSDADGIRHKLLDEDNLKQEDAIYMLVSCSAFTNYLIKKNASL